MKDTTGTRFNFTVTAGLGERICVNLQDSTGLELDLAGTTWTAMVYRDGGAALEVPCEHGGSEGELYLDFPALAVGTYAWELVSVSDAGEMLRCLYGVLAAVSSELLPSMTALTLRSILRTLDVRLPSSTDATAVLRWRANSIAQSAAEDAKDAAEEAKRIEQVLLAALAQIEAALAKAEEALDKLNGLDDLLKEFQEAIYNQITISDRDTWIIGGVDTGRPSRGEDGEDGEDGLDGDKIRRVIVASVDDIPNDEEAHKGGTRYYVRDGNEWDVYEWVLEEDGTPVLIQVTDTVTIATANVYGIVKLGTNTTVDEGAPVGTNASGQMTVQAATTSKYGSIKVSTSRIAEAPCIGKFADGSAGCTLATLTQAGVVKLGSAHSVNNAIPYLFSVGSQSGKLCNNILFGGAIKHMTKANWLASGMEMPGEFSDEGYQLGLLSSPQFTQSEERGLELNPATADLLAGVYVAEDLEDERENAVLPAAKVAETFYTKEEVDAAVASAVAAAVEEVKQWVAEGGSSDALVPPGTMIFALLEEMPGYLLCNGASVSREEYPRLFDVLGTQFGSKVSSDFNLPDMRGRVLQGSWYTLVGGVPDYWDFRQYKEAGLPNIIGRITHIHSGYGEWRSAYPNNALETIDGDGSVWVGGGGGSKVCKEILLDASKCNSTYGQSSTVQPAALAVNVFIKY